MTDVNEGSIREALELCRNRINDFFGFVPTLYGDQTFDGKVSIEVEADTISELAEALVVAEAALSSTPAPKGEADLDTKRLDYLEKIGPFVSVCQMPYYENRGKMLVVAPGWGQSRWHIKSNVESATQDGLTLRGAIDSSMSGTDPNAEFFFAPDKETCPYCKQDVHAKAKGETVDERLVEALTIAEKALRDAGVETSPSRKGHYKRDGAERANSIILEAQAQLQRLDALAQSTRPASETK